MRAIRAIILTGRNSWQLENAGNHMTIFPPKFGGWVELLEANGYTTGYTGKGWGPGFARDANGKPKITGTAWQKQKDKPPARYPQQLCGQLSDFQGCKQSRGQAVGVLVWHHRAAPRVRVRGRAAHGENCRTSIVSQSIGRTTR